MKRATLLFALTLILTHFSLANRTLDESFEVSAENVEIRETTPTSINLKAESDVYSIKLVPNQEGNVIFSLSGIGYTTTMRVSELTFQVNVIGYRNGEPVYPAFSSDDLEDEVALGKHTVTFKRLHGSIPVWFNQPVDSINLQYSNSKLIDVHQYLRIHGMRILKSIEVFENPEYRVCDKNEVMIAFDGSSSVYKEERKVLAEEFVSFIRQLKTAGDTNVFTIVEYGSQIQSVVKSEKQKTLLKALKNYKRRKNVSRKKASFTNWASAFDQAIEAKPDLFVFLTDGWPNWYEDQSTSFTAIYQTLIDQCNQLKRQGTHLLFITSTLDNNLHNQAVLSQFLNGQSTATLNGPIGSTKHSISTIDLIMMHDFKNLEYIDLTLVAKCLQQGDAYDHEEFILGEE